MSALTGFEGFYLQELSKLLQSLKRLGQVSQAVAARPYALNPKSQAPNHEQKTKIGASGFVTFGAR